MPAAPVKFTHRVPNVSGGLVTGTARIEQRTDHVRTHTLHDPVAYQRREVGRWIVEGELPEPTWYS
ncbi:hypothetical protein [Streptomyces sp. LBL]|uniref:hypothetical protein n=1 Tax=Streptomyces sp. LBL TaxID=2940562 RepID=UPI0024741C3A|nr:hypothetical protein [Streptomyces sp. LBL]